MDPMEFLPAGLITILISACVCLVTLVSLGAAGFFVYRVFKNMSQNSGLLKNGVSAPAVIISVEDTGVTMNYSPQVRLTLQVTPADRPPFQAVATTFVGRMQVGMIVPGASVTVRYDPNDISKVAIESVGTPSMNPASVAAVQAAVLKQEEYYKQLRERGEEARAKILTVEDSNIHVEGGGSILRFKMEVMPRLGDPFQAETQAAVADASRDKYAAGKMVYVFYDPANKAQVALDRAA
jgi:hypothetical protein